MSEAEQKDTEDEVDIEDVPVASTESYTETINEERWVVLKDARQRVKVVHVAPFKLISALRKYNLMELFEGGGVSEDDMTDQQQLAKNYERFVRNVVVPRVVEPEAVFDDPDADPSETFDLSELTIDDTINIITSLMGQDADELDIGDDEDEPFR
jgi:hypothetical protein